MGTTQPSQADLLKQILNTLQSVRNDYRELSNHVHDMQGRLSALAVPNPTRQSLTESDQSAQSLQRALEKQKEDSIRHSPAANPSTSPSLLSLDGPRDSFANRKPASPQRNAASGVSSRIILTTYPGQSGIDPLIMNWGHPDPAQRGPVVVSRSQSTIRRRNGMPVFAYDPCGSIRKHY